MFNEILLHKHYFVTVSLIFMNFFFLRSKLLKEVRITHDDHMGQPPSKKVVRYLPHQPNYLCQRITEHVLGVSRWLTLITVCSSKACSACTDIATGSSF